MKSESLFGLLFIKFIKSNYKLSLLPRGQKQKRKLLSSEFNGGNPYIEIHGNQELDRNKEMEDLLLLPKKNYKLLHACVYI